MKKVTQGTLIYGMRSSKYPGIMTYGIIISAACDLDQDKITKVFHLTAVPLKDWLCSNEGFRIVTTVPVNNCKNSIVKNLEKYGLAWDVFQTLSQEEFETVATANGIAKNDKQTIVNQYEKYQRIAKDNQTFQEKTAIYKSEHKAVEGFLGDLFNGGNTHYVFVPQQALSEQIPIGMGLVVDLLELDFFPMELVEKIADGDIDYRVLPKEEISIYDKRFILSENDGFVYPVGEIEHPWCEYVLQHFANCFIRIGVDNPGKKETKGLVDNLFQKED